MLILFSSLLLLFPAVHFPGSNYLQKDIASVFNPYLETSFAVGSGIALRGIRPKMFDHRQNSNRNRERVLVITNDLFNFPH